MARPHVAIVTTVAPVHLAAFENLEGIAEEKAAIFRGLEPGGCAVFNGDLGTSEILLRAANQVGARILRFGPSDGMDIRLADCRTEGSRTLVDAVVLGKTTTFALGSPGRHLAMNALGVLGCVAALDADVHRAARALSDWQNVEGRGRQANILIRGGGRSGSITLIDDSYNANPASVAMALEVLATAPSGGRRVAFLGDMLELGRDEAGYHSRLAELEAVSRLDVIHCAGPLTRFLHEALPAAKRGVWTDDADGLAQRVAELVESGDVVMIKGSNGSKMQRVVDAIKALEIAHETT
jgi:UDP-N-acetylmuramoyl-tripeptide--D-alanyl-D-alanine ligase